ncbi:MAG: RNA polymerase sigma factor [Bacteroidales bacterium]|nr:RNA polymerase sigma factor [Bacteroidales bacterium]MCM1148451.1 RNA polymerase sigma factor [Bacteroidales bacterium]MCM1207269.1 RNA polymerase sigma factor [Bacillota bacterium]MCM1511488.1 RNA polymerase sigma factor [Clostridium sp.]
MKHIGSDNEPELVRRMQSGDHEAMRTVYEMHAGYLAAVCSRYVVDGEDVRDVLQESFVRIFSGIGSFRPAEKGSLKSWMTRIVVNESLKFIRRRDVLGFAGAVEDIPDCPDTEPETEKVPFPLLLEMIRSLPAGYRTVFNLVVFERKSHKEVALMLGIKEGTSASQFHRAKAMLARKISEHLT